jgi:hypothetical protein
MANNVVYTICLVDKFQYGFLDVSYSYGLSVKLVCFCAEIRTFR